MVISTHLDKNRPKFIENLSSTPAKPLLAVRPTSSFHHHTNITVVIFSQRLDLPLYERLKLLVDTLGEPGTNVSELKVQEEALSQLANVSFSLIRFFIWGGGG